jgi:hypothetical protein
MRSLLHSFLGNDKFEQIISDFHDEVKKTDLVKHYFLAARKDVILRDLKKYHFYLTPKSDYDYAQQPVPSSKSDIQIPSTQFQEVTQILVNILRKNKIVQREISQLLHEILEIVEETRSQCNETEVSTLDRVEINPEKIYKLLSRNRIVSEVMPSKAIRTEKGLPFPIWIRTDYDNKELIISGKIVINDTAMQDDISKVIEKSKTKAGFVNVKLEQDTGPQYLIDDHRIPFNDGIPIRLFTRYLQRFSADFNLIFGSDENNILRMPTA